MVKNSIQGRNQKRKTAKSRRRNRRIYLFFLPVSFAVVVIMLIHSLLFDKEHSKESADISSAESQAEVTFSTPVSEKSTESDLTSLSSSDTDWNLTLVNKWNPLPENYEVNLVEVPGGEKVDERIYQPLMEMLEAAKEGNWNQLPTVVSGYRTQEKQQELYDEKIAEYTQQGYSKEEAIEQAEQWVAVPGHSEHQLGIAVDINGATYDLYFWLQENSYKYGFIFRYPAGKTDLTGTAEEVWHYRYVGVEAATEMYEQNLCLEEYLTNTQKS